MTTVLVSGASIAGELAAAGDHERGFANYDAEFRGYVERNQTLVDVDEELDGSPIAPDDFHRVVHSIEPKDY
jgi:coenzyme F420-reducing hydrogenase gamma subunit